MRERQVLGNFDPALSDKFFSKPSSLYSLDDVMSEFDCAIPSSPQTLQAFFNSQDGRRYKEKFAKIIESLKVIANQFGVKLVMREQVEEQGRVVLKDVEYDSDVAIEYFKQEYYDYDFKDTGKNGIYFPLYRDGVPGLSAIVKLLQDESIPIDSRKSVVKDILQGIYVCAPGVYTHVTDSLLRLQKSQSLDHEFMLFRKEIAQALIKQMLAAPDVAPYVHVGNEIHYVNGVINRFDDMLGIVQLEDILVKVCQPAVLMHICEQFPKQIGEHISLEKLFEHIIDHLDVNGFVKDLADALANQDTKRFNDLRNEFEAKVGVYGVDGFRFSDIVDLNEDYTQVKKKNINAIYSLYATLIVRLSKSGFIASQAYSQLVKADGMNVFYLPGRSLKFAFHKSATEAQPLIPLFIEGIGHNSSKSQILRILLENKPEYHAEIREYAVAYLNEYSGNEKPDLTYAEKNIIRYLVEITGKNWQGVLRQLEERHKSVFVKEYLSSPKSSFIFTDKLVTEAVSFFNNNPIEQSEILLSALLGEEHAYRRVDTELNSALHLAAQAGCARIVAKLLRSGKGKIDINLENKNKMTPLMCACHGGDASIVKRILSETPFIYTQSLRGYTVMHHAAASGNKRIVQLVAEAGAIETGHAENGYTALHLAVMSGAVDVVGLVADLNISTLDKPNNDGVTPLALACEKGASDIVEVLLNKGASIKLNKKHMTKLLEIYASFINVSEHSIKVFKAAVELYLDSVKTKMRDSAYAQSGSTKRSANARNVSVPGKLFHRHQKSLVAARLKAIVYGGGANLPLYLNNHEKQELDEACSHSRFLRSLVKCYESLKDARAFEISETKQNFRRQYN